MPDSVLRATARVLNYVKGEQAGRKLPALA
jgi:hypothetical protein